MKFNLKTVVAVILGLIAYSIAYKVSKSFFQPKIEDQIVQMCDAMNRKLPMMVDKETRWDSTSPGMGKEFTYRYTLINRELESMDVTSFKKIIEPQITNGAKTSPTMKKDFFDRGIRVKYNYSDRNRKFIYEVVVEP